MDPKTYYGSSYSQRQTLTALIEDEVRRQLLQQQEQEQERRQQQQLRAAVAAARSATPTEVDDLRRRLSHVSASIVSSVRQIPPLQLDSASLREVTLVLTEKEKEAAALLQAQLFFVAKKADGTIASPQRVTHDGEELVPHRLLPGDGGVEMRGQYICEYRSASGEYMAEVAKSKAEREDAIAHCKKLLIDLPVALSNSRIALATLNESDDADLSELGAMVKEQKRIQQEIDAQTAKLAELDSSPEPMFDKSKFALHRLQTSIELQFGANRLGDQIVHVRLAPGAKAHTIDLLATPPPSKA